MHTKSIKRRLRCILQNLYVLLNDDIHEPTYLHICLPAATYLASFLSSTATSNVLFAVHAAPSYKQ